MNADLDRAFGCQGGEDCAWLSPTVQPTLKPGTVHLWRADLQASPEELHCWQQTLSVDEQQRMSRLVMEQGRQRFVAGRGILRAILGRYLGKAPASLEFIYSEQGKPTLVQTNGVGQRLHFNLSHSGDLGLYALTWDSPLGVDVERARSHRDVLKLAQRFFQPAETAAIAALPLAQQPLQFVRYWTAKEAYLKATGQGLMGLSEVEVDWSEGESPQLRLHGQSSDNSTNWWLKPLDLEADCAAAIVVAGGHKLLTCWQWPAEKHSTETGGLLERDGKW